MQIKCKIIYFFLAKLILDFKIIIKHIYKYSSKRKHTEIENCLDVS